MTHTMPVVDIITQLQKVAQENPGLEFAINDQEWGIGIPMVKVQRVYEDEYGNMLTISPKDYKQAVEGIEEYAHVTAKDVWDSNPSIQESYEKFGGFSKFSNNRDETLAYFEKVVKNFEKSKEIITVTINENN